MTLCGSVLRYDCVLLSASAGDRECRKTTCGSLCRSKIHRCWSGCLSVLVDESTEDAGAEHSVGVEVVYCGGVLLVCGW